MAVAYSLAGAPCQAPLPSTRSWEMPPRVQGQVDPSPRLPGIRYGRPPSDNGSDGSSPTWARWVPTPRSLWCWWRLRWGSLEWQDWPRRSYRTWGCWALFGTLIRNRRCLISSTAPLSSNKHIKSKTISHEMFLLIILSCFYGTNIFGWKNSFSQKGVKNIFHPLFKKWVKNIFHPLFKKGKKYFLPNYLMNKKSWWKIFFTCFSKRDACFVHLLF